MSDQNKLRELILAVDDDWSVCTGGGRCQDPGGIYDSNLDSHVMSSEQVEKLEQAILEWVNEVIGQDEFDQQELDETENGSEVPFLVRNDLRAEQRKRAGL